MMQHIPAKSELRDLMERHVAPCISLYLPTSRAGADPQQNTLRFRHLIQEAESHLLLNDLTVSQVDIVLEPARKLLENELFWLHPHNGLAVFRSPDLFRTCWLPGHFREQVIVTRHFYLRPLHPFLTDDGHFYLLALSHNHVRLIEGTRFSASDVVLPEAVPRSLAESMRYRESSSELQYSGGPAGALVGKGGRRTPLFHGQRISIDDEKGQLLHFFQQVDRGLHALLREERAPLILAGVAFLLPFYRKANTYAHLLEEGIAGNPDRASLEILHRQAWAIAESFFSQKRQEVASLYKEYSGNGRASNAVKEVVLAALDGRVESLLLEAGQERWGAFNPATRMLHVHQQARFNDDDLVDIAATQTLLHGGSVYVVERGNMPGEEPLAAVLRS